MVLCCVENCVTEAINTPIDGSIAKFYSLIWSFNVIICSTHKAKWLNFLNSVILNIIYLFSVICVEKE